MPQNKKNNRLLIWVIVVVSAIANVFFIIRAITENTRSAQDNPFNYNIEFFEEVDPALLKYKEIRNIPVNLHLITGIAVDTEENIYISGDDSISIYTREGHILSAFPTGQTAHCLDVYRNGDIYLGMKNHIEIYDRDGIKKLSGKIQAPGHILPRLKLPVNTFLPPMQETVLSANMIKTGISYKTLVKKTNPEIFPD